MEGHKNLVCNIFMSIFDYVNALLLIILNIEIVNRRLYYLQQFISEELVFLRLFCIKIYSWCFIKSTVFRVLSYCFFFFALFKLQMIPLFCLNIFYRLCFFWIEAKNLFCCLPIERSDSLIHYDIASFKGKEMRIWKEKLSPFRFIVYEVVLVLLKLL